MRLKSVALASAVLASLAYAPLAEAGNGVRLNFGGPLGAFTATPSKSAASRHAHRPQKARRHAVKKSRPSKVAREASHEPSARPAAKAKPAVRAEATPKTQVAKADVAAEVNAPLTGSSALIQTDISEGKEHPAPAKDDGATDVVFETSEPRDANEPEAATSGAMCSKFIPAAGMTVTVECER